MAGPDTGSAKAKAYTGSPATIRSVNTFDWLFSNPFAVESEFVPRGQIVPQIEDDRPIFVDEANGRSLTYSRLKSDALALAAGLQNLGLDPDDTLSLPPTTTCPKPELAPVVLIQLPNCVPFATVFLATLAAGYTATLVSPALTSKEIAWVLQNARPRIIFTASSCLTAMQEAIDAQTDKAFFDTVQVHFIDVLHDSYPLKSNRAVVSNWETLFASSSDPPPKRPNFDPESHTAVILWSSGTSGRSKGVLLSHHALNFATASLWYDVDFYLGRQQRWLAIPPFYHIYGLSNIFLVGICAGATVYTMPAFKFDSFLNAIRRRRITFLQMAPPIVVLLAKSPAVEPYARRDDNGRNAFSSVVAGVAGGAPLGHDIIRQVYERLGFRVRLGYGLTETTGGVTVQSGLGRAEMEAQKGDTGHVHWGVEVMVSHSSSAGSCTKAGEPAAVGEAGEILTRSKGLLSAYLPFAGTAAGSKMDMSLTDEALTSDGWFRTGDAGIIDKQGHLTITDRIKELIKVKGFQVAPAELEALLCSSDAVADAGVVGVYDEDQATEWPLAYVVPADAKASKAKLLQLAKTLQVLVEAHTARYKWLRGGIVFVDRIPKSPSGKILRRLLRDGGVKGLKVALYERRGNDWKL